MFHLLTIFINMINAFYNVALNERERVGMRDQSSGLVWIVDVIQNQNTIKL